MMAQGLILPLFIVFFRRNIITNSGSFRPSFSVLNGTALVFYNKKRRHSNNGYLSPLEVEQKDMAA